MHLKTNENELEYRVHFFHTMRDGRRLTICSIHHGPCRTAKRPCDTPFTTLGYANCSPRDNFSRRTGRKLALGRAMITHGISKPVRTELWQDYFMQEAER